MDCKKLDRVRSIVKDTEGFLRTISSKQILFIEINDNAVNGKITINDFVKTERKERKALRKGMQVTADWRTCRFYCLSCDCLIICDSSVPDSFIPLFIHSWTKP